MKWALLTAVLGALLGVCQSQVNQPPVFIETLQGLLQNTGLKEDKDIGYIVGSISATDPENILVRYDVVSEYFEVNEISGQVTLIKKLDREADTTVFVRFIARDNLQNQVVIDYTVTTIDVNDNRPTFVNLPYSDTVSEFANGQGDPVNSVVFNRISVTDSDISLNADMDITCVNTTGPESVIACERFGVNQTRQGEGRYSAVVYLKAVLNFEEKRSYTMTIMAKDRGEDVQLNRTVNIVIEVQDVQDTNPAFLNVPLSLFVGENSSPDVSLGVLRAKDQDEGAPRPIFMRISRDPNNYFKLDNATGDIRDVYSSTIRSKNNIDKEAVLGVYTFDVEAFELDSTGAIDTSTTINTTVTVVISDVNDEMPTFNANSYTITIPEELDLNTQTPGLQMVVTDRDQSSNAGFEVSIAFQSQPGAFIASPNAGISSAAISLVVQRRDLMDYEIPAYRTQIVQVVARERNTAERFSSNVTVTINLEDINDNTPQFTQPSYSFNVREDRQINDTVFTVSASDADSGNFGIVTYELLGGGENLFRIEPTTGRIHLAQAIDFEQIQNVELRVQAKDGGGRASNVPVSVTVINTNDHLPQFTRDNYQTSVPESSTTLDPPVTVSATDPDGGNITYSLSPNTPSQFGINQVTGRVFINQPGVLYTDTPRNASGNLQGFFELDVIATDTGTPAQSSHAKIIVTVIDLNDNAPMFVGLPYSVSLSEIAPPGNYTAKVSATDADIGSNGEVFYTISAGSRDDFVIDSDTGVITVSSGGVLDYDVNRIYQITVVAVDKGSPPQSSSAIVTVSLIDANNKKPSFPGASIERFYIAETVGVDTLVGQVVAVDTDTGSRLEYSLMPGSFIARDPTGATYTFLNIGNNYFNFAAAFRINAATGQIFTNVLMQRDKVAEVQFDVKAEDKNAETLDQAASVTVVIVIYQVVVGGVEFTNPPWTPSNTKIEVQATEEEDVNTAIFTLLAQDTRNNDAVRDFVMVSGSDYLTINRGTGQVVNNRILDFETIKTLNFVVVATSNSSSSGGVKSAIAEVTVRIQDINDNSPVFDLPNYDFHVIENSFPGTTVGYTFARDADSGIAGTVRYSISGQGAGHFTISQTGTVSVAQGAILNREAQALYNLMVTAADNNAGSNSRTTAVPLRIYIDDDNDNTPTFNQVKYEIFTNELIPVQTSLGSVYATDGDINGKGQIWYRILTDDPNTRGLFDVHQTTGVIRTRVSLEGKTRVVPYKLIVEAYDQGPLDGFFPRLSSTVEVEIQVGNIQTDGRPYFTQPVQDGQIAEVKENKEPGTFVFQVQGRDSDSDQPVLYSFLSSVEITDHNRFTISSASGIITTTERLDREEQAVYELILVVTDQHVPVAKDNQKKLRVFVTDEEDNDPIFGQCDDLPDPTSVTVLENVEENTYIATVTACDKDVAPNNMIYYSIIGGNECEHFKIDAYTAVVRTNKTLDREKIPEYNLEIAAENRNGSSIVKRAVPDTNGLRVIILDIDDNGPSFETLGSGTNVVTGILASTPFDKTIYTLRAYDADTDMYHSTTYSIAVDSTISLQRQSFTRSDGTSYQAEGAFTIERNTGKINTNKANYNDYVDGYFTIHLIAKDKNNRDATTILNVYVFRETFQTRFTFDSPPSVVQEFLPRFIGNLTDAIASNNYKIVPHEVRFHVNSNSETETSKSDVCVDVIQNNQLIAFKDVQGSILTNKAFTAKIEEVKKKFEVIDVGACSSLAKTYVYDNKDFLWWLFVALAALIWLLATILAIVVCLFWSRYRKKTREAVYVIKEPNTMS